MTEKIYYLYDSAIAIVFRWGAFHESIWLLMLDCLLRSNFSQQASKRQNRENRGY